MQIGRSIDLTEDAGPCNQRFAFMILGLLFFSDGRRFEAHK